MNAAVQRPAAPPSNMLARRDPLAELSIPKDPAAVAAAEHSRAMTNARWLMALQCPRDIDDVAVKLLKECARPSFADEAIYHKPVGDGVEGLSIRFVEVALQIYGNTYNPVKTIVDDDEKRIVNVSVIDLESNTTYERDITIAKTKERKQRDDKAIGTRTNHRGETLYIIPIDDDAMLNKESALISKALRTAGLRILPGWLKAQCEEELYRTRRNEAARDPDAEKNKILDGFAKLHVLPSQIKEYLGKPVDQASPAELVKLRGLWKAIADGEATWDGAMKNRAEPAKNSEPPPTTDATPAAKSATDAVNQALQAKAAKRTAEQIRADEEELEAVLVASVDALSDVASGVSWAADAEVKKRRARLSPGARKRLDDRFEQRMQGLAPAETKQERQPGEDG